MQMKGSKHLFINFHLQNQQASFTISNQTDMLTLLLLLLLSKIRAWVRARKNLVTLIVLTLSWLSPIAQTRQLIYEVTSNSKVIGTISVTEKIEGDKTHLMVLAKIKPRVIVSIPLNIREEAWLENGIMIRSSYHRRVNGNTTLSRITQLKDNVYESVLETETTLVKTYPLKNNILTLFTREPTAITNVYSNAMATLLPLRKVTGNVYEIVYPDGKRNQYQYKNNICTRILLHQTLFNAQVNLKSFNQL